MSNSRENVITRSLHGKFGDQVVFRTRNGKSITADIPKRTGKKPAKSQVETRDRFKLASIWARTILADPGMLEAYTAKATNGKTPYVVAMTDYLKPPRISEISAATYKGHAGDVIRVAAFDDFMVAEVKVQIRDAGGNLLEEGACQPDSRRMYWLYVATTEVPSLPGVEITAIATDNPGHTGEGTLVIT
jgi:hypothetical protein